jgi:hypothetical protein
MGYCIIFWLVLCRRLEDILDAFADKVAKPHLFLTDKMLIALGKKWSFSVFSILLFCIYFSSICCLTSFEL